MLMQEKKPASPAAVDAAGAPTSAWRRNRLGVQ
jgi:hypothetical protein